MFSKVACNNIRNELAQWFCFYTGINYTRPTQIYGSLNTQCNLKCIMCHWWSQNEHIELPPDVWIKALLSLKKLAGNYFINFGGGEPLIYKGLFEILKVCKDNNIMAGLTTNGVSLDRQAAERLITLSIFNCNISIDAADAKTHDYLRGVPGSFDKAMNATENIFRANKDNKKTTRVIWKMTVNKKNIEQVPALIYLANKMKINGVNFQPVHKLTKQVKDELWVMDIVLLRNIVEETIELKKRGYPIMAGENAIRLWEDHFCGKNICSNYNRHCTVCFTNYQIRQNGDVVFCDEVGAIGNIQKQSAFEIWNSVEAKNQLSKIVNCRNLCLSTNKQKKSIWEKAQLFKKLMKV